MGVGASLNLPSQLTKDQAKNSAFNEALFDSYADSNGLLGRDQFLMIANEFDIFM